MPLESLLPLALGGLAEAIAGKTLDLGIDGARKAGEVLRLVEERSLSDVQVAAKRAVDAARAQMLDDHRFSAEAQQPGALQDLVRLLEHPPFAEEVAGRLLFAGQIDFPRLRRFYLQDAAQNDSRWQALTPHLERFFGFIESHLLGDPHVGPLLTATRSLALQLESARQIEIIATASAEMKRLQERTAQASERSADASERMAADLARLLHKMDEMIAALGRNEKPSTHPAAAALSDIHLEYLRSWFAKPWTLVKLADISQRQDQATLLDVYVPLQVDCNVVVQVKDHQIVDWWIATDHPEHPERAEMAEALLHLPTDDEAMAEMLRQKPKERSWRDLGVDEAAMQQIIDGIGRKIAERRAAGQETEDRDHHWYMEAHDAASVQPRSVLLGDPGGGKSSFLRHMTLCQAGELRRRAGDDDVPPNASLVALKDWLLSDPLTPIYIELRDLVRLCFPPLAEGSRATALPTVEDLWRYVREHLLGAGLAPFETELRRLCRQGEAMLLLDGLDEVPLATDPQRRDQIKALIAALHGAYPRLRMAITGRPHAYRREEWELPGFGRAMLQPLEGQRLYELALALFQVVVPDRAEAEAQAFIKAIRDDPHIDRSLHANPLFFTLLAAIWFNPQRPGQLPPTQADLYRQSVDLLLDRWTRHRTPDASVVDNLGIPPTALRPLLETLACTIHEQSDPQQDTTTFHTGLLLQLLYEADFNVRIKDVPDYLTQHAGILVSRRPGEFAFIHRSFQEHLAACELLCSSHEERRPPVPDDRRFPAGLVQRIQSRPDLWENVARLAADDLSAQKRNYDLGTILVALTRPYVQSDAFAPAALLALEIAERHSLLAETPDEYDERHRLFTLLQRAAIKAMTDTASFAPEARAKVAQMLGRRPGLDTRRGVGLRPDGLPDIDWVQIPEMDAQGRREFIYQDGKRDSEPTFWMARYPTTYAQFQAFVDAEDGLRNGRWFQGLARTENSAYQQNFKFWNHPRENVTWYQALAFCRWLSEQAKDDPSLLPPEAQDGNWRITLPTEWQWEKAARGHDGPLYPWGNEYISGYANVDETEAGVGPHKLGQTSAVGLYAQGASPYGILDLSGNVWEWCLNEYSNPERIQDEGDEWRVLRGGSWYYSAESASASSRHGHGPWSWYRYHGFRVVVVPTSHG
ncbi:MAG: SUMF1/EgtB/PvdO family nonheme iron enzyme [Caldilineaceae bacterium]|nr:SUMF1/EgtB/PvdO family nonheme iron enzyme [Caldilineaceae bacterium]